MAQPKLEDTLLINTDIIFFFVIATRTQTRRESGRNVMIMFSRSVLGFPWIEAHEGSLDMSVGLQSRSRGSPYFQRLMDGRRAAGIAMQHCEVASHSFHVASDKVRVGSKSNDDAQYTSELVARGSFTVRKDTEMVYGAAKRGMNITCSCKKYLPESVEERRMRDRGKKHSDFIGFIELYVEKLKEILQQNKTLRVIRRDTSQWHKITLYYVVAIRKLVRSGKEREKKYDQSILRVVGTVFNLEALVVVLRCGEGEEVFHRRRTRHGRREVFQRGEPA